MKALAWAFFAGLLFGIGLIVGGMTQPNRIIGFLDIGGDWMPGLALVMAGAIAVYLPVHRMVLRRPQPLCTSSFSVPKQRLIDGRLVVGAALFGVGWGLGGFCPGPAITSLGALTTEAAIFVGAMYIGFAIERRLGGAPGR